MVCQPIKVFLAFKVLHFVFTSKFKADEILTAVSSGSELTMKLSFALLIVALAMWSGVLGSGKCGQKEGSTNIESFHGRQVKISVPCKYNAVRQQCGKYHVTLTPGIITVGKRYRLNTLWLGIRDETGNEWEGRTTNKIAVKYINGDTTELFNQKSDGILSTFDVLTFDESPNYTAVATAIDESFKVTFTPWDPDNNKFRKSSWSFQCFEDMTEEPYPGQVCGIQDGDGFQYFIEEKTDKNGDNLTSHQTFLYNLFTDKDANTIQVDEKCLAAEDTIQNTCQDEDSRKDAIRSCSAILTDDNRRNCVIKYACSPMDVFVDCVQWVCGGYQKDETCRKLAASIDLCREFTEGDLTKKVHDSGCYTDFLPIWV